MPAPSQSQLKELNRRKEMIEYKIFTDEELLAYMENEEKQREIETKEAKEIPTPQQKDKLNAFLLDTFEHGWSYDNNDLNLAERNLKPEMVSPIDIDWNQRIQDIDPSLSGQYTLNPETQNLDFEKAKVFIPNPGTLKQFVGKKLAELAQYIQATYSSKYYIPGIEYWQYIFKNPSKTPASLKDGNYYFFFGSIIRHSDGYWRVPYVGWDNGSRCYHEVGRLNIDWYSSYRVVLLKK